MKKKEILGCLILLGILVLASSSSLQEHQGQESSRLDVPYVPTPPEVVEEMLRLVDIKSSDLLYDLGCGDGRIVIAATKKYGIKAIGIDIDPVRITESNENAAKEGVTDRVQFIQQNFFESDFRNATVITMYLLNSVDMKLRPKLLAELKPGTRLVSHEFDMGEWEADKTSVVSSNHNVFFWVVPANFTGQWEWDLASGSSKLHYTLHATQQFQKLSATGKAGNWLLTINDVVVSGDEVKFLLSAESGGKITSFLYWGKIQDDTITGTATPANNPKAVAIKWRAVRDPKTIEPIDKELSY